MTQKASPPSPSGRNLPKAFAIGGLICCIGQGFTDAYKNLAGLELKDARTAASMSLILIAALLTAFGWFAPIARHAGAGTLVPITGFANSIVSPSVEFKSEGFITGVGVKMFTIAGPVIVYGTVASVVYGLVYWIIQMVAGG